MKRRFFIAGTDTDVGKTFIACELLKAIGKRGHRTMALKPIAAGCQLTDAGLRNEDAVLLQQAMTVQLPYEQVNPVAVEPPIAPHIALQQLGRRVTVAQLAGYCRGAFMTPAEITLVEGAGGWRVPLSRGETLAGLAKELQLPVILVVGMKLGCLNHALLSAEAILADGLVLAGWIANQIDPEMAFLDENIVTLQSMLPAPCLGVVPYQKEKDKDLSDCFDLDLILSSE